MNQTPATPVTEKEEQPLRMNAYYYGFDETGVRIVDEILSEVAIAGKSFHHTESWSDPLPELCDAAGKSHTELIQEAAQRAAGRIASDRKKLEQMKEALQNANDRLRRLKNEAGAELSEWEFDVPMSTRPTSHELTKAQERYDRKRAAWEGAGKP